MGVCAKTLRNLRRAAAISSASCSPSYQSIMTKKMLLWQSVLASVLVLLCMLQTAAPQTLENDVLQEMGSLLGLPLGKGDASTGEEDIPDFVRDIHNCWDSNNTNDCLPGYHGTDVNQLRASLGISENRTSLPAALHSYNKMRELKNSLAISFNVSLTGGQGDIVRYAMLRVYREPVELALLQENCSNFSLQLYTQTSTEGENSIFTLRGVQSLSQADFTQGEWVEFLNLTNVYRTLIETIQEGLEEGVLATGVLNTRLTVNSPSCSNLSPSSLGFTSVAEHRAQLVGFEENSDESIIRFSDMMTFIARFRRDSDRSPRDIPLSTGASSDTTSTISPVTVSYPLPTLPANFRRESRGCALYSYYVSFESLGWSNVVRRPLGVNTNVCTGHCNWPQPKTNKHAHIQSSANFQHPDRFPKPCCAPVPGSYRSLPLTIRKDGQYVTRNYAEMIATGCACL